MLKSFFFNIANILIDHGSKTQKQLLIYESYNILSKIINKIEICLKYFVLDNSILIKLIMSC